MLLLQEKVPMKVKDLEKMQGVRKDDLKVNLMGSLVARKGVEILEMKKD